MGTFVAFAFKVSAIFIGLAFEITASTFTVISAISVTTLVSTTAISTATFAFSTKATTRWFEWQWFFTRNFNFWKTVWILNGQAQNIHSQFFRSEFCSQFASILAKLLKVGPDFFIFKVSLNFLQRYLFFRLEGFFCCCRFHSLHPLFGQVLNDLQIAHFIWRNKGNGLPCFPSTTCPSDPVNIAFWILWNIVVVDMGHT